MIKSFKHKGIEKFYLTSSKKGIQAPHSNRLRIQLAALDTAQSLEDMDIPGYRLHQLTDNRKGTWSVTVNGNWRTTFKFADGNVYIVNCEDYH